MLRTDKATSKVRIVFDGSACSGENSSSLNDNLEVVDNFMPPNFETLMMFRLHAIALTSDIENAFLQIELKEFDRDALRFLWFDYVNAEVPNLIQMRIKRVPFGLRCSPANLGATIRHHVNLFTETHSEAVRVLNRLYADDMSCSVDSSQQAFHLYKDCKDIMKRGDLT